MASSNIVWRSDSPLKHVRELENQLRTSKGDEGLREHLRILREAWGIKKAKKNFKAA
jgi:hypothetical protein